LLRPLVDTQAVSPVRPIHFEISAMMSAACRVSPRRLCIRDILAARSLRSAPWLGWYESDSFPLALPALQRKVGCPSSALSAAPDSRPRARLGTCRHHVRRLPALLPS